MSEHSSDPCNFSSSARARYCLFWLFQVFDWERALCLEEEEVMLYTRVMAYGHLRP